MTTHNSQKNQKAVIATKKAKSLMDKVLLMIDEDKYCIDIIQQVDAVLGLLKSTKNSLLRDHLEHCLEHKIKENKQKTVEELLQIYSIKNK